LAKKRGLSGKNIYYNIKSNWKKGTFFQSGYLKAKWMTPKRKDVIILKSFLNEKI
jgi:hypothetical protein